MIAQLGMYDRPSTRAVHDRFWGLIRSHLGYGPHELDRSLPLTEGWLHPDLLFSQTCGYPFRAMLVGKVTLIGTPDYGLEGCPPGFYRSVFVARVDDTRNTVVEFDGASFAYNEAMSQSGWAAPRHYAAQAGISFGPLIRSGGHEYSARAVQQGHADFSALDAVTWRLLQTDSPWCADLKVIGHTMPTPALPYICGLNQNRPALLAATRDAISDMSALDRKVLGLKGIIEIPTQDYLSVPTPAGPDKL